MLFLPPSILWLYPVEGKLHAIYAMATAPLNFQHTSKYLCSTVRSPLPIMHGSSKEKKACMLSHISESVLLLMVQAGKSLYRGKGMVPHVHSLSNYGLGCLQFSKKIQYTNSQFYSWLTTAQTV